MESTRPIRALMRGLDALTVINVRGGATVSEVAQEIRLPRTTVYRILETLGNSGFLFRDPADDRYRLRIRVQGLSDAFRDEPWVTQIATPQLAALCREIVWPVSIATLSGTAMMLRETTDHTTPLAIERFSAGIRVPLLNSATGRAYLAFCPAPQRETLIELLARSTHEDDTLARAPRAELLRLLADIKVQEYAMLARNRRLDEEVGLSVPVRIEDRPMAVLTVRFLSSAVPVKASLERFLPKLRECAARIGALVSEHQAGAPLNKGAPQAVA